MSDFEITDAARTAQSVSIGLFGPSGCGKTLSALRLAVGIQSVVGGNIYLIDTEARRSKDYAPREGEVADNLSTFAFKHVDFTPPFGSDRYLEAIEKCRAHGPEGRRIIIIDSLSHEHESEGGMLEQFEKELERLGGGDKNNARAWIKPKARRRKLVVRMEQMRDVSFILTFRAADQTKPGKDKDGKNAFIHLGFMPIGGREFVFCTKACAFLPPSADGIPVWNPEYVGEKMMRRLPGFLAPILNDGKPLSQEHGRRIAEWALGGSKATSTTAKSHQERVTAVISALTGATTLTAVEKAWRLSKGLQDEIRDPIAGVDPHLFADLKAAYTEAAAKFAPKDAESEIDRLVVFATKARDAFLRDNHDDLAAANKALEALSEGACKGFNELPKYLSSNPAFEQVIEDAIGGGE